MSEPKPKLIDQLTEIRMLVHNAFSRVDDINEVYFRTNYDFLDKASKKLMGLINDLIGKPDPADLRKQRDEAVDALKILTPSYLRALANWIDLIDQHMELVDKKVQENLRKMADFSEQALARCKDKEEGKG